MDRAHSHIFLSQVRSELKPTPVFMFWIPWISTHFMESWLLVFLKLCPGQGIGEMLTWKWHEMKGHRISKIRMEPISILISISLISNVLFLDFLKITQHKYPSLSLSHVRLKVHILTFKILPLIPLQTRTHAHSLANSLNGDVRFFPSSWGLYLGRELQRGNYLWSLVFSVNTNLTDLPLKCSNRV